MNVAYDVSGVWNVVLKYVGSTPPAAAATAATAVKKTKKKKKKAKGRGKNKGIVNSIQYLAVTWRDYNTNTNTNTNPQLKLRLQLIMLGLGGCVHLRLVELCACA